MIPKAKWRKAPDNLVALFYDLMEEYPTVQLRKMFGYPCAFLHGHMFIGLHQDNMILRLPAGAREELLSHGLATPFAPIDGRVLKEYASLNNLLLANKDRLRGYIAQAIAYVQSLPAKAPKGRASAR